MPDNSNTSKNGFLFGLVTGIAVIAVLGFFVLLVMNLSDKSGGTQLSDNTSQQNQNIQADTQSGDINIPITASDHVRGNSDATVTIVEFSDFQCPYCQQFHATMKQLFNEYPNDIRWVYKHFPLESIHPMALSTAQASECAGQQGKFWEFADGVFSLSSLTDTTITSLAKQIGLDMSVFQSCLDSGANSDKIEADYMLGIESGVRGTPGNIINGQLVSGALPIEQMRSIVKQILTQ